MDIEFSDHAKQQLKRRNIDEDLVSRMIKNPHETLSSFRDRRLLRTQIDDKILEVVTKKEGSKIIVITAYYLDQ